PLCLPHSPLYFYCAPPPRALHSFPTRRSSDLPAGRLPEHALDARAVPAPPAHHLARAQRPARELLAETRERPARRAARGLDAGRSEEHTSELQSLTNLVCRLLLETKKTTNPPS